MMDSEKKARHWAHAWSTASAALTTHRIQQLQALSAEEAARAAENLLALAITFPLSPSRQRMSGLVEQQRYFCRARCP